MNGDLAPEATAVVRESFWRRRVLTPILAQLRCGITPEKVALTVALGFAVGIFPLLGTTTLLCALAAYLFRLNQPIIQLVNYFAYPLQLALLLVFYRAGETLFGRPHMELSISLLMGRFRISPMQFLKDFGMIGVQGVVVWVLLAPLVVAAIYGLLLLPLRAMSKRVLNR